MYRQARPWILAVPMRGRLTGHRRMEIVFSFFLALPAGASRA